MGKLIQAVRRWQAPLQKHGWRLWCGSVPALPGPKAASRCAGMLRQLAPPKWFWRFPDSIATDRPVPDQGRPFPTKCGPAYASAGFDQDAAVALEVFAGFGHGMPNASPAVPAWSRPVIARRRMGL